MLAVESLCAALIIQSTSNIRGLYLHKCQLEILYSVALRTYSDYWHPVSSRQFKEHLISNQN